MDAAALKRAEAQIGGILTERVWGRLRSAAARESTEETLRSVATHDLDPYAAVDSLLRALNGSDPS